MASSAFPFGQYRRTTRFGNYVTPFANPIVAEYINTPSDSSGEGIKFIDNILYMTPVLEQGIYYILRVKVPRTRVQQVFNVRLQDRNNQDNPSLTSQYIGRYVVPPQVANSTYSTIQLIINPRNTYSYIVFELERTIKDDYTSYDESVEESSQTIGRVFTVEPFYYGRFENINRDEHTFVKIGIQSTPGMLFCINGEGIRVGPSGIYQINNGYEVSFIGAAVGINDDSTTSENTYDNEYFTIDYRIKN